MAANNIKLPQMKSQVFTFGPWSILSQKSHILQSNCMTKEKCSNANSKGDSNMKELCSVCRFDNELILPQLPDMTFGDNILRISHSSGCAIEFNCLDALKLVNPREDVLKVAIAKLWQQSRAESDHIQHVVKPFDWTFTTDYKGTIFCPNVDIEILDTDLKIDMEKLKIKETIMFYEDIHLFEDELADNGCAHLSIKMRVMESSFFVLLRFFLRVDNLLVRINDTRLYHESGTNYILREYASKEGYIDNLKDLTLDILKDPTQISDHLPVISSSQQKLVFPSV